MAISTKLVSNIRLNKARWKTRVRGFGIRGPGVRGPGMWKTRGLVENTGCGNYGVWWKTRGLSAKHGGNIISPNNEVEILLFQIAMKINRRETRFLVIKAN